MLKCGYTGPGTRAAGPRDGPGKRAAYGIPRSEKTPQAEFFQKRRGRRFSETGPAKHRMEITPLISLSFRAFQSTHKNMINRIAKLRRESQKTPQGVLENAAGENAAGKSPKRRKMHLNAQNVVKLDISNNLSGFPG